MRLNWVSRLVTAQGGERFEFHVSSLPDEAQKTLSAATSTSLCRDRRKEKETPSCSKEFDCGGNVIGFRVRVAPGSNVEILMPSGFSIWVEGVLP